MAEQVSIERNPNERERGLPPASSSKGDQLGQRYTGEVGRSDKAITVTALRDKLNNYSVDENTKNQIGVMVLAVEEISSKNPTRLIPVDAGNGNHLYLI